MGAVLSAALIDTLTQNEAHLGWQLEQIVQREQLQALRMAIGWELFRSGTFS
jgi:hypothetical protein